MGSNEPHWRNYEFAGKSGPQVGLDFADRNRSICERYASGRYLREVGEEFGITGNRVRQIIVGVLDQNKAVPPYLAGNGLRIGIRRLLASLDNGPQQHVWTPEEQYAEFQRELCGDVTPRS